MNSRNRTKVNGIIPCIEEAIDSILNQTFGLFDFLIINDGSTDRTAEILQSYQDPRIKIINRREEYGSN